MPDTETETFALAAENLPMVLTMGDAAGIGPEIIVRAYQEAPQQMRGCFVAGDLRTLRQAAALLAGPGRPALSVAQLEQSWDALHAPPACIPVLQVVQAPPRPVVQGALSAQAGRMAAEAVLWAARAALRQQVRAIVTAPLHKEALAAAGFPWPGHTELLQSEAAQHAGCALAQMPVRMMLANEELRTVLVSIHLPLREAIESLSIEGIVQTLLITHRALSQFLGRPPRIAVAGLNPHAGEGGRFGSEEQRLIAPAVVQAERLGLTVSGPWAPDTVFMRARHTPQHAGEFDVVLAMYHDQGLIPVKYLGVDEGVNVTLGLPLVRTSPDHGTAFDIAGKGLASAKSLLAAVRMARQLSVREQAEAVGRDFPDGSPENHVGFSA